MEKNNRFRNHISIVFENSIRTVGVLLFIFVGRFVTSLSEMDDAGDQSVILLLLIVAAMMAVVGWQLIRWAKTYISIQDNALVVERNTLNRKRNTIGIKNVSNVNLEQNLLEMLLGTCKVKLDTNSLSTADQTDVQIVLKKKDAEEFRKTILGYIEEKVETKDATVCMESKQEFVSGMDDIIKHGIFSVNITSLMVLAGALVGIVSVLDEISLADAEGGIASLIMTVIVAIWGLGGFAWGIAKGFVKYVDFKIARKGDKIFLKYGLLKKVDYSIPVNKINGIRFTQTFLARLGKCYMVEVINVGLDDDETEEQSFFLPYAKRERIEEQMKALLPEFDGCFEIKEEKQEKSIWTVWIPAVLIFLAVFGTAFGVCVELYPETKGLVLIAFAAVNLLCLIRKIGNYHTAGVAVDDRFFKVVDGAFGRKMLFVKYEKIQFVKTKQNILAKKYDICKGEIHLLASMKNQVHNLPYFRTEKLEELKKRLEF